MNVVLINREAEKALIEEAFKALDNYNEDLLPTPILDFYGIEGIGKTSMIDYVEQKCQDKSVPYIRIDGSQDAAHFSSEVIRQLKKYNIRIAPEGNNEEKLLEQSAEGTKALIEQSVAVMLLDAVDPANEPLLEGIATILRSVIEENKLFVVLTSRRNVLFDTERSVARKLTSFQLKPFSQKHSETYLESISTHFEPEVRDYIFDWTRGYPLAMQVMAHAIIEEKLDPRKPEDQKVLLNHIVEKVIDGRVLARVKPDFFQVCRTALTLFSIPRRFNLVIMKALIEAFDKKLKQPSGVAYMSIPRSINQATDVLHWNVARAGFSVNDPVRALFFLKSRIEDPERHLNIHRFLARLNKQFADEVHDLDRLRYLREYLYHSAHTETEQNLAQILEQTMKDIISESPESAEQFYEEFQLDEELKEVLGEQKKIVLSQIYRHQAQINRQSARESVGTEHIRRIQDFFYYVVEDPLATDLSTVLQQQIEQVLAEEPEENISPLINALLNDSSFKESLGKHFETFASLLSEHLPPQEP
jgi:hypothetical protein